MIHPVLDRELRKHLETLPYAQQQQVLNFARALALAQPRGVPGSRLLPFAGTIPSDDLAQMQRAVEDCERVSLDEW
jgi:hypothetical protein